MQGEAFWICNGLLCLCAFLMGGKMAGLGIFSPLRLLIASGIGGLCSLGNILFPSVLWLMGIPLGIRLCYGRRTFGEYLRVGLMFFAAMLLSGGGIYLMLSLNIGSAAAYMAILGGECFLWLLLKLTTMNSENVRQIELSWQGKSLLLPAMLDSGNLLKDVITGLPVIVAPLRAACRLEPDLVDWYRIQELPEGFRLLKVRTAAGSCMMPLFRPSACRLYINGRKTETRAVVAVAGPDYTGVQALIPCGAIENVFPSDVSAQSIQTPV